MSLNRSEQRLFDYWEGHRDERHFWVEKVRSIVRQTGDDRVATSQLEGELWRYYLERSAVAAPFKDAAMHEGLQRISMKNLAELIIRLWTEPRPKNRLNEP